MTILYALLVLLAAVLVTTITSLYDLTIYSYSIISWCSDSTMADDKETLSWK